MHRLLLIRHAKAGHPSGVRDLRRPLNERGLVDAAALGEWLAEEPHLAPSQRTVIAVSPAERTRQTWSAVEKTAGAVWQSAAVESDADIYEASPAMLREVALRHGLDAATVVIVGHNPGIGLLARELAAPSPQRARLDDGFPTSAVAVLQSDAPWHEALEGVASYDLSSFVIPRG